MFDHVTIRVSDRAASRGFYETVLGRPAQQAGEEFDEWDAFSIAPADGEHPVTQRLHVAFAAHSREDVDSFWRRGVDAGYRSDGGPGPRPHYADDYYGGFLLDPDGNSVEAVHRAPRTESGPMIDHLWLGVADLAESRRFWETVAAVLLLRVADASLPGLVSVSRARRHLMLVADGRPPTLNLHLAFPVATDAEVVGFHSAALAAGYRDNGEPGERPQYHAGYVGAFVLDPDGNNIEAVNHNR
jgi:catechol 2,3-dioxygenase-like lactoylglutathione lyase family enzyme